jgi:hypothetical protein
LDAAVEEVAEKIIPDIRLGSLRKN